VKSFCLLLSLALRNSLRSRALERRVERGEASSSRPHGTSAYSRACLLLIRLDESSGSDGACRCVGFSAWLHDQIKWFRPARRGSAPSVLYLKLFYRVAQISRLRSIASVTATPRKKGERRKWQKRRAGSWNPSCNINSLSLYHPLHPRSRLVHDENYSYQFELHDKNRKLCLSLSLFINARNDDSGQD
jgi:hypothetical protein